MTFARSHTESEGEVSLDARLVASPIPCSLSPKSLLVGGTFTPCVSSSYSTFLSGCTHNKS